MNRNNMKLFGIITVLMVVLFINVGSIFASVIDIDSLLLKSDSVSSYSNPVSANYNDNISAKLSIEVSPPQNGFEDITIVFKTYSIDEDNDLDLESVSPTITKHITNNNVVIEDYDNFFYTQQPFIGYKVVAEVRSLDGIYFDTKEAFVNIGNNNNGSSDDDNGNDNNNDDDYDEEEPDNNEFFLSGLLDIYLDEDENEDYKLHIVNNNVATLHVLSVTASEDPNNLDIDDITYPSTISGNESRYAQIDLESSTVSSDYTGYFDIEVIGYYTNPDESITKTYTVNYHIDDEDSVNNSNCSDIRFDDYRFTLLDNSITTKRIRIENRSDDYDFELDEIEIEDNDFINSSIISYPTEVREDSTEFIDIEFETDNINSGTIEYVELTVRGDFIRNNTEDKRCTKRQNLRISINDNSDPGYTGHTTNTSCDDIKIFAPDISLLEDTNKNYSKDLGFYLVNTSNKKFNINGLSIIDNSNSITTTKLNNSNAVYPESINSINFNLYAKVVGGNVNTQGVISLNGTFDDGSICNLDDTRKYFDITILDSEYEKNICKDVSIISKKVSAGNNIIEIFNNTNEDFTVSNFLVSNAYNLETNLDSNTNLFVGANSSKEINGFFSGHSGILQLLFKGELEESNIVCDYYDTTYGIMSSYNQYNFIDPNADNCDIAFNVPSYLEIDDSLEQISYSINNFTPKGGVINVSANGAVVSPNNIYLDGSDNFSDFVTITNFDNPKTVYFDIRLNNCEPQTYYTQLLTNDAINNRLAITSYPTSIRPQTNNVSISLDIKNDYSTSKEVVVKLSGFPNNWTTADTTTNIDSHTAKTINKYVTISEGSSLIKYNGFIDLYLDNARIESKPITIDLSSESDLFDVDINTTKSTEIDNVYIVDLFIKNNSSSQRDVFIDFNLDNNFVIEGDRNITLLADQNTTKQYKIVSTRTIRKNTFTNILVKDKSNNIVLVEEEILLEPKYSPITGFITLSTVNWIILLTVIFVIILVRLILLDKGNNWKVIRRMFGKTPKNKPILDNNTTNNSNNVTTDQEQSKITDYNKQQNNKGENKDKTVSLDDLKGLKISK